MSFLVNIEEFEGPLDLMLYLIKENKLDLFDLDLVVLTNQYIAFIHQAQDQQLQVASEYLAEMASLIELKSRRLLPKRKSDEDSEDDLDNPRSLVSRLLEYQRYKEASLDLSKRFIERQYQLNLFKSHKQFEKENQKTIIYQHDIYDLIKVMNKVLQRQRSNSYSEATLTKTEYSIDECIDTIRHYLKRVKNKFSIEELFNQNNQLEFKIVTFLAVLDLILMKELAYTINSTTHEIILQGV